MNGVATRVLIALVQGYRMFFSAWLGAGCRFEPTCSVYALDALRRHGALAGSWLVAARLLRCRPGCDGGFDPVPAEPPGWLGRSRRIGPGCSCVSSSLLSKGRPAPDVTR